VENIVNLSLNKKVVCYILLYEEKSIVTGKLLDISCSPSYQVVETNNPILPRYQVVGQM
jgi:hypothetical protein